MRGSDRFGRGCEAGPPRTSLARSEGGVVAVEFALIVPFLLALYVGCAEYCRAMINSQVVDQLAHTVADLTALSDTSGAMPQAKMDDIFASSALVLMPFDATTAKTRVSVIGIYRKGSERTVWLCSAAASNTTARSAGAAPADLVIPASYNVHGSRLVVSEVTMPYAPVTGAAFSRLTGAPNGGAYPLSTMLIWPTRAGEIVTSGAGNEVILPNGKACPDKLPS